MCQEGTLVRRLTVLTRADARQIAGRHGLEFGHKARRLFDQRIDLPGDVLGQQQADVVHVTLVHDLRAEV